MAPAGMRTATRLVELTNTVDFAERERGVRMGCGGGGVEKECIEDENDEDSGLSTAV